MASSRVWVTVPGVLESTVSRIRANPDRKVAPVHCRPLGHAAFPCVVLEAADVTARIEYRVASRVVVIATGATAQGRCGAVDADMVENEG